MTKTSSLVIATAVCALFSTHAKAADSSAPSAKAKSGVECTEKNSCAGKGSCKSAANACGGKNSCKNHEFEAKSAKACKSKKGTVKADAPADSAAPAPKEG